MPTHAAIDQGRHFDWGRTSQDYVVYRPGPPASFYDMLARLGVGLPGQRVLDLGTGTGVLAREMAARGVVMSGVDISPEQIGAARALAEEAGLHVEFREGSAEEVPFPDGSFQAITANQCWFYFDAERAKAEARRLLTSDGVLVTSHFSWLPRLDPIAALSEELVLKYNPQWGSGDWDGRVPSRPRWTGADLHVRGMFYYDEAIPFTRESWRGRMRACRGVGAELEEKEVQAFDAELDAALKDRAEATFTVLHRIDAHVLRFSEPGPAAQPNTPGTGKA